MEHLTVPEERVGLELDEFLCLAFPHVNKGFLRAQVRGGRVLVDGSPMLKPAHRLRWNEVVSIDIDDEELPVAPVAPPSPVPILHEDEHVLVVDKPAGLAVEPERWRRDAACLSGALLQAALERADATAARGAELEFRPRLVHRIDKDTSGAVLVAKDLETERRLRIAFEEGQVAKDYLALVEGEHPLEDGEEEVIDATIGADARRTGRMLVGLPDGKPSRTRVRVEQRFEGYTLLRCSPLTGRTHQIRVHLSWAGFPLVIDPTYGRRDALKLSEIKRGYKAKRGAEERPLMARLTLHASAIGWPPAGDGATEPTRVEAPLPADFTRLLRQLSKVRPHRRWRS